jgi:hypothetical protein
MRLKKSSAETSGKGYDCDPDNDRVSDFFIDIHPGTKLAEEGN